VSIWLFSERRGFVEPAICRAIQAAMDVGTFDAAEVLEDTIEHREEVRRTLSIEVDAATLRVVEDVLERARPALERDFRMQLGPREGPGFLRYLPGGFYRPHRDRGDLASWPGAARRQLAVVIFLNGSQDGGDPDGFEGGLLRFPPEGSRLNPIDVIPQAGTLVAFEATALHEVTRVGDAVRDAVVDWFY
jgi:predicted 2-oxoglutarate/Fe(II)-dependent dioxygenase YbiX